MRASILILALPFALVAKGSFDFDAGADIRIRQEIIDRVPGLPGGGMTLTEKCAPYRDQLRFRPRVWGEAFGESDVGKIRLRIRFIDEFRHYFKASTDKYTWPDEVIIDNLFLEGKDLFDKTFDFTIGRQDIHNLYGLDHLFDDGTPDDYSRTFYSDMARGTYHLDDGSTLDFFGAYDTDDNQLRVWGIDDETRRAQTGFGGKAERGMDDWGFGAIWGSELAKGLPYQVFVLQQNRLSYERGGTVRPWTNRELVGTKVVPQLDENWSLQLETAGEVGCNGDGATLSGWYGYTGLNWKPASVSETKPFATIAYQFMSGDEDAADENGGDKAWDPMWGRGIKESIIFAYGTLYGAGYWSNMHYPKVEFGVEFGRLHQVTCHCGPIFAAVQDELGGGDGMFKGLLSQARYDFPLRLADKSKGQRFEMFGHLLAELFNPGDYYETGKPAYLLRWQVEVKF